ncbi:MAG TPA: hypothetical protein VLE89_08000 [Chlamydiales bacterium]|nr:hypothetical protein [Chlamydiales bacterium]
MVSIVSRAGQYLLEQVVQPLVPIAPFITGAWAAYLLYQVYTHPTRTYTYPPILPERDDEMERAMAASLAVFNREKKIKELDRPPSIGVVNPVPDPLPEDSTCTLMGTEIPSEYCIVMNENAFDIRYFVKAILTQEGLVSPYTRGSFDWKEVKKISHFLAIRPTDLEDIWEETDQKMRQISIDIDRETEREVIRRLGTLPTQLYMARILQQVDLYNHLSEQATEILRAIPDPKVRKIDKAIELRTQLLSEYLEQAQKQKKITPQYLKGFYEILENPMDSQNSGRALRERGAIAG